MYRNLLCALVALVLAGCAATAVSGPSASDGRRVEGLTFTPGIADIAKKEGKVELLEDARVKCEKYTPTGSHRVQFRCTTVAEKKAAEEANQRVMRKLQAPPPSVGANTIAGAGSL